MPAELLSQLAPNGRLVMPVGPEGKQVLVRYTRRETGCVREELGPVSFVPLLSGVIGPGGR